MQSTIVPKSVCVAVEAVRNYAGISYGETQKLWKELTWSDGTQCANRKWREVWELRGCIL